MAAYRRHSENLSLPRRGCVLVFTRFRARAREYFFMYVRKEIDFGKVDYGSSAIEPPGTYFSLACQLQKQGGNYTHYRVNYKLNYTVYHDL